MTALQYQFLKELWPKTKPSRKIAGMAVLFRRMRLAFVAAQLGRPHLCLLFRHVIAPIKTRLVSINKVRRSRHGLSVSHKVGRSRHDTLCLAALNNANNWSLRPGPRLKFLQRKAPLICVPCARKALSQSSLSVVSDKLLFLRKPFLMEVNFRVSTTLLMQKWGWVFHD